MWTGKKSNGLPEYIFKAKLQSKILSSKTDYYSSEISIELFVIQSQMNKDTLPLKVKFVF